MTLKIVNSEVDNVTVLELNGRIVLGEESNSLRETLRALIAQEKRKSF